jgi:hypothetical protein
MKIIDICEVKADLSELIEQVVNGEQHVIQKKRLGFMGSNLSIPDDFDRMGGLKLSACFIKLVNCLPMIHKDPFDRMLVAQAMVEGITLLTADSLVAQYPVTVRMV